MKPGDRIDTDNVAAHFMQIVQLCHADRTIVHCTSMANSPRCSKRLSRIADRFAINQVLREGLGNPDVPKY
jgi:hypothetical protein